MINIKCLEVAGFASALQALHLPFGKKCNSDVSTEYWSVDTDTKPITTFCQWKVSISEHDETLIKNLLKAGDEHAKILRGVVAYLEIKAPRYWWVEFDTYRIGREQLSSESTMHMQGKGLTEEELIYMKSRLPEGTMQKRVQMISYQTLRRMVKQRHNHRLPEWREFCNWIINNLQYPWMITENG